MPVPVPTPVLTMVQQGHFPAVLLDQFGAMSFLTVGAAHRIGVFDALAERPSTPEELSERLDADPTAMRVLLAGLVAYDYVEHDRDTYRNGPQAQVWLAAGGREAFGAVLAFWSDALTQLWSDLPEAVRTGRAQHDFYSWLAEDEDRLRGFGLMQDQGAADLAGPVADLVTPLLAGPQPHVLDVGGGWGRFAEAICRAVPDAQATVVELPETALQGADRVAAVGLGDRISFHAADLREDQLPGDHDLVLLANVLHTFDATSAAHLVRRAADRLRPGGVLVVVDHLVDLLEEADPLRHAQGRGFDLHLLQTQSGQLPSSGQVTSWITGAGLEPPQRHVVEDFPIHHVLIARSPAAAGSP